MESLKKPDAITSEGAVSPRPTLGASLVSLVSSYSARVVPPTGLANFAQEIPVSVGLSWLGLLACGLGDAPASSSTLWFEQSSHSQQTDVTGQWDAKKGKSDDASLRWRSCAQG